MVRRPGQRRLGPLKGALRSQPPFPGAWTRQTTSALFRGHVAAKQRDNVLDYDDLLLYSSHMMAEPRLAAEIAARFDHVLVDESRLKGVGVLVEAVEFSVAIGGYEGTIRAPAELFSRLLGGRPVPEKCLETYHLQRTRFERAVEGKLRRRELADDGNVELVGRDLRLVGAKAKSDRA